MILRLFCSYKHAVGNISFLQAKGARTSAGAPEKSNTSKESSKTNSPEPKISPGIKRPAGGRTIKGDVGGKKAKKKEKDEEEEKKVVVSGGQRPKNSKRRSVASKVSYKEESNSEGEEDGGLSDEDEFQATSEDDSEDSESGVKSKRGNKGKGKAKGTHSRNTAAPKRRSSGGKKQVKDEEDGDLEEEEEEEGGEGTTSNGTKRRSGAKREGPGADEWLEVYLEKTASWVCVDVDHGVGVPQLCYRNATTPVTYVVSVDGDGFVKDLGKKYDPTWMTSSRKRRVDDDWWEETLEPFLGPEDEKDTKEDKEVTSIFFFRFFFFFFLLFCTILLTKTSGHITCPVCIIWISRKCSMYTGFYSIFNIEFFPPSQEIAVAHQLLPSLTMQEWHERKQCLDLLQFLSLLCSPSSRKLF